MTHSAACKGDLRWASSILIRWRTLRRPAYYKLFFLSSLTRIEARVGQRSWLSCVSYSAALMWKHAGLQWKPVGWSEPHRLPAGNLSSRGQTRFSKVSVQRNLLERHSCWGIKLVHWCWQHVVSCTGRGQRVVRSYFITFKVEKKCHKL